MKATDSRQRTVPVTCATSARTISAGSLIGLASTLATTGTTGGFTLTFASACAITSAAGCISAQWKGADTGSSMARLAPLVLAISTARSTAALSPDTTTWPPPLSLAAWQTCPCAASAATAAAASNSSPISAAMAPTPTGTAFCMACPRVRNSRAVSATVKAPARGERRIFAERMAGDELRVAREIETGFRLQHAHGGERDRHQRRLGVLGERERLGRAFEDDGAQLVAERLVDLVEDLPRPARNSRPAPCPCRPSGCPGPETRKRPPCPLAAF